jgi:hypothetical protein
VIHYRNAVRAALVAAALCLAAPAASYAADSAALNSPAATALDTNLLQNPGFETVVGGVPVPYWAPTGDVRVETFGMRAFPSQSYGTKWHGGSRYLACNRNNGSVSQTVNFDGWKVNRPYPVTARFRADYGGETGWKIRVSLLMTGDNNETPVYKEKFKTLDITNHYLLAVVTLGVPIWATHIQAKIDLMKPDGTAKCKIVADTSELFVYRDG